MENRDYLSSEQLAGPELSAFIQRLPELAANGLRVERLNQLIQAGVKSGIASGAALSVSAELMTKIYQGEPPWWFNPDRNLAEIIQKDQSLSFEEHLILMKDLAAQAGFAFRRAPKGPAQA